MAKKNNFENETLLSDKGAFAYCGLGIPDAERPAHRNIIIVDDEHGVSMELFKTMRDGAESFLRGNFLAPFITRSIDKGRARFTYSIRKELVQVLLVIVGRDFTEGDEFKFFAEDLKKAGVTLATWGRLAEGETVEKGIIYTAGGDKTNTYQLTDENCTKLLIHLAKEALKVVHNRKEVIKKWEVGA